MTSQQNMGERDLDRTGETLRRSSKPFIAAGAAVIVVGIVLILAGDGWVTVLGIAITALAIPLLVIAGSLILTGGVSWWAARRKPFA